MNADKQGVREGLKTVKGILITLQGRRTFDKQKGINEVYGLGNGLFLIDNYKILIK